MPGSPTTPGWPSARVGALGHIAFHYTDSVGTRDQFLSRLNGWPARPPADASPTSSRMPAHGLGPMWTSGRGASCPAPPPQIPPCSFPAVGSRRRSNAIEGRSLAAHVPPTRRLAASVTRRPGSESGACVAARLSFDRPPSLHSLRCRFVVGFVRGFIGTTQPSDSSRLPQQLRLLDFLSWPGIALRLRAA